MKNTRARDDSELFLNKTIIVIVLVFISISTGTYGTVFVDFITSIGLRVTVLIKTTNFNCEFKTQFDCDSNRKRIMYAKCPL